jgi:hypothetical protein
MEVVAPSSVNYRDHLPLGIEAQSHRRLFFPSTGDKYSNRSTNIIRIDVNADAFLDTSQSYLSFKLTNESTKDVKPDLGQPVIKKLTVSSGGVVLEEIHNYNQLVGGILIPSQAGAGNLHEQSLNYSFGDDGTTCGATAVGNYVSGGNGGGDATATNGSGILKLDSTGSAGDGGSVTCCYKLISGLLDNDKYLPLSLLNAGITLEIELCPGNELGMSRHAAAADINYALSEVRYAAHLINLSREFSDRLRVVQQASGGNLSIAGTSFRSFTGDFKAQDGPQSINIPCRVRSIKSIFWKLSHATANDFYNLSAGGHGNISQYQLKIGAVNYPPTAITCSTTNKITPYLELQKAFGKLGSTVHGDLLGAKSYFAKEHPTMFTAGGVMEFCPFGIDLESFRHQIENGVDTSSRSLPMTLELTTSSTPTAATAHIFVMYDSMFYVNIDGTMKVSS